MKTITVIGATGSQGGAVARALLQKPGSFRVRAVTRSPDSEKATKLRELGAEVVQASLEDSSSLKRALDGCHGVFVNTASQDAVLELQQGKNAIDAAQHAKVNHVVYSGAGDLNAILGFNYSGKADTERYLLASGLPATTVVRYGSYMENFFEPDIIFYPKKQADGTYVVAMPDIDTPAFLVDLESAGQAVATILEDPAAHSGKCYGLTTDKLSITSCVDILGAKLPTKQFKAKKVMQPSEYSWLPPQVAGMMFTLFLRIGEIGSTSGYDVAATKKLVPEAPSFDEWVSAHTASFEAVL